MKLSDYKLSPLEGQPMLPITVVLSLVFGFLALITDGFLSVIMWILVVPFAFLLVSIFYMRFSSKWAGVHYPLMIRYATAMGHQTGKNSHLPLSERVERGIGMVILGLYPNASESEQEEILKKLSERDNVFMDKELLVKMFKARGTGKSDEEIKKAVDEMVAGYNLDHEGAVNSLKVSHIISELIRIKHGEKVQMEYIFAVITGRAK